MTTTPYFVKSCPACGRTIQIKVNYLGKDVCCTHCGRQFMAEDPESQSAANDDPVHYWINFTENPELASIQDSFEDDYSRRPR